MLTNISKTVTMSRASFVNHWRTNRNRHFEWRKTTRTHKQPHQRHQLHNATLASTMKCNFASCRVAAAENNFLYVTKGTIIKAVGLRIATAASSPAQTPLTPKGNASDSTASNMMLACLNRQWRWMPTRRRAPCEIIKAFIHINRFEIEN